VAATVELEEHAMANNFRFGRRLKLPSTVEIKHELRMIMLADSIDALQREAAAPKAAEGKIRGLEAASQRS
jgi:hypothetical protein